MVQSKNILSASLSGSLSGFLLLLFWAPSLYALPKAPLPLATSQADDDVVAEFKRFFGKYKDSATRTEAVLVLQGVESVEAVAALIPVLGDDDPSVVQAAVSVLSGYKTEPPISALVERLDKAKKGPILGGLLDVVAKGSYGAALDSVAKQLKARNWTIRRRAVVALTAIAPTGGDELLLPLVEDKEVAVRCAVLDGLAALNSRLVLKPALADLEHDSWQVRASAIRALGMVRDVESIEPLIVCMETEEGRLVEDAAWSLGELTGQGFALRTAGWRRFWETWKTRYRLPTLEELAKKKAAKAESQARYEARPDQTAFGGVETPSRSILFVIDVSGSMDDPVVEVARFREAGHTEFRRIDIVKTELTRTIENLASSVEFNILTFATDIDAWKKKLVRANVLNKSSAIDWISKLEPIGGSSKQDLHEVGLIGAANLEGGKTNTYLALMTALGVLPKGRKSDDYEVKIDTIFFLSDGLPSMGELVEVEDLLAAVDAANELRKIRIHTIGIGSFQKAFLRRLARENGGQFVDLGK